MTPLPINRNQSISVRTGSNDTSHFRLTAGSRREEKNMEATCTSSAEGDQSTFEESGLDEELVALQNWLMQPDMFKLARNCWACRYATRCGGACNFDETDDGGQNQD